MERISNVDLYLGIANLIAKRGRCLRLQVGAVITLDNRIISTGYNGPLKNESDCNKDSCDLKSSCTRAVHAEANAIYFAARMGISLKGATIYCTHSPCIDCCEAIVQAGIVEVIFTDEFRDPNPLDRLTLNGVKVYMGEKLWY